MSVYNNIEPSEDESHQAISSYFLGPKAENYEYFKQNILTILDGQRDARLDYYPRDGKFVTEEVQASKVFRNSTRKVANAVRQASRLLAKHSIPFCSWELLNLQPKEILDIPEKLHGQYHMSPGFLDSVMKKYGIQSTSKTVLEKEFDVGPINYFVSNTRHYSWPKAAAVTGIGSDYMIGVQVDHGARVDLRDLEAKLQSCLDNQQPVYAVVAIIGSTEEGAVDPLRGILRLRKQFQKKGLSFLLHGDGAWGGYFCTMLPQGYQPGQEINLPSEKGSGVGFVPDSSLRADTQEDLFMLREVDSITIDPHKAAYIPYPAGGLCYRDGRMRYLVTWTMPCISRGETTATSIGVFGIEGSKPGASVMSTWFSNACIGLGPNGYGQLLGEVTFTCSRFSAEWAAMSTKDDPFTVVPLNELPSETKSDSTPEKVEAEKQKIRERVLQKTNAEIVSEDESRPKDDKALALLRALGSDLNINAFSTNWRYADGTLNAEVEEANHFNLRVIQRLSVDSPEDDPTEIPFYLTSTTFQLHEYGECAQHFKKRLGLYVDQEDLVVMRNVVMSPWPTDGNFIARLVGEFRKVLVEEVQVCRERNDVSPTTHEFLLQGHDKLYIIHFPMFHLEKHRHQLIMEIEISPEAKKRYTAFKKAEPQAVLVVKTLEKLALAELVAQKKPFKANIIARDSDSTTSIAQDVSVKVTTIIKDRSLKGRFRDESYPSSFVPFYLYGGPNDMNIDHILVRSPNIHLSADNIQLSLDKDLPAATLAKGAILAIHGISEAAMQPFQSTEGPLGDTLAAESNFFFRPGQEFQVSVYEDAKAAGEPGPGIVDVDQLELIGKGTLKLGEGRYVDSVQMNIDPFEMKEGDEKFKAWKKIFDQIGKELE
ncbi:hypothetical protein P7C71_g3756, partial [Lecanoromycetidae sp. Uapishka_2]